MKSNTANVTLIPPAGTTEQFGNQMGRMAPAGLVTTFPVTTPSSPATITAAADGNLWFAHTPPHQGRYRPLAKRKADPRYRGPAF